MKRKLLAMALALSLGCGLAVPAGAASTAEERLAAVTAQVKKTLGLDTERYTAFNGNLAESALAPSWDLEWSDANGNSLSVSATEEGKILRYYSSEAREEPVSGSGAPTFPAGSRDKAREAAFAFLGKVLDSNESVALEDGRYGGLGATVYRFEGQILVNGLPAGLSCSISVSCASNEIQNFYRDDLTGRVMGGVPGSKPVVLSDKAGETLKGTLKLRLEYVLDEEDEHRAVLRYLPEYGDEYYVDAADGKLVNLTELRKAVDRDGSFDKNLMNTATAEGAAEDSVAAAEMPAPTPAEIAGAEKLKGVLDKKALDGKARAITALGLRAYTLSTADYAVPREKDEDQTVTATLRYGRQVNGVSWRRTVTLDAKTGALLQVYSSGWMPEEAMARPVDNAAARKNAESFLKAQSGARFAKTELYDSSDALEEQDGLFHSFTFCQKANGYFLPSNSLYARVDATDGSIAAYNSEFDDSVVFDSPDGILTMERAVDAWLGTYDVTLQYVQVPAAVDYSLPEYEPLKNLGIAYLYKLVLGYRLERETGYSGIDAKTGQPVELTQYDSGEVAYSDLEGCWAREKIEALAQYRVGFVGGKFQPDKALTQLDMALLLTSVQGYRFDPEVSDSVDEVYEVAYRMGTLRREERNDNAVLTRMDAIRMILNAAGYGEVARLQGIYKVGFSDAGSIAEANLGYAALAQGLGIVTGSGGKLNPNGSATRAQAAVMVYNLLARNT